jgi:hypothetical protein
MAVKVQPSGLLSGIGLRFGIGRSKLGDRPADRRLQALDLRLQALDLRLQALDLRLQALDLRLQAAGLVFLPFEYNT